MWCRWRGTATWCAAHLDAELRLGCEGGGAAEGGEPGLKVGLIGAKVAVQAEESLRDAPAVDFVARNEFDFTVKEVAEGRDWAGIEGLS